jgi:hypothetical protein
VAELVEGDLAHSRATERVPEPLTHLRGVEHVAGLKVGEDEIVIVLPARALEEPL